MATEDLPPSAVALAEVLAEGGPDALAIRAAVHRTMLWKYTKGLRRPGAESSAKIDKASRGRVPAAGWGKVEQATSPAGAP